MATEQLVIDGLDGFRALVGKSIGQSAPVTVTHDKIGMFCDAVDNEEWIHHDVERCKASPFGDIIAPGAFTFAYFPSQWFSLVEIKNISTMLLLGADRIRLLAPIKSGSQVCMEATVESADEKDDSLEVRVAARWRLVGAERPCAVATIVLRYAA
jgi:acyl dehydratase